MSKEIKFKYIWSNPEKTNFISQIFTLDEIEAGNLQFYQENEPLLKDYKLIARVQFIGLLDENGKKIFVGDVIKIKCNEDIIIGYVFYKQSRCCYMINHPAGYNGSFALHTPTIAICDEFHIVGNIYQNPELLGGENE
jgi:uncharacterized phage protein (TIGR01671 family)